jgi:hypothetical protein
MVHAAARGRRRGRTCPRGWSRPPRPRPRSRRARRRTRAPCRRWGRRRSRASGGCCPLRVSSGARGRSGGLDWWDARGTALERCARAAGTQSTARGAQRRPCPAAQAAHQAIRPGASGPSLALPPAPTRVHQERRADGVLADERRRQPAAALERRDVVQRRELGAARVAGHHDALKVGAAAGGCRGRGGSMIQGRGEQAQKKRQRQTRRGGGAAGRRGGGAPRRLHTHA